MVESGWDGAMCYIEDAPYNKDLWAGLYRDTEFEAFGLALGIYVTAMQLELLWQRSVAARRQMEAALAFAAIAHKTFRYYVRFHPHAPHVEWYALTAAALSTPARSVTVEAVQSALELAENAWLAEIA